MRSGCARRRARSRVRRGGDDPSTALGRTAYRRLQREDPRRGFRFEACRRDTTSGRYVAYQRASTCCARSPTAGGRPTSRRRSRPHGTSGSSSGLVLSEVWPRRSAWPTETARDIRWTSRWGKQCAEPAWPSSAVRSADRRSPTSTVGHRPTPILEARPGRPCSQRHQAPASSWVAPTSGHTSVAD